MKSGALMLALDLAGHVGWALGAPEGTPQFGTHTLPSDEGLGRLLLAYHGWIKGLFERNEIGCVVFESPHLVAGRTHVLTARRLMSLVGLTCLAVAEAEIVQFHEEASNTVMKFLTGHGRFASRPAKKAAAVAAVRALGWNAQDDDSADALALWAYAEAKIFDVKRGGIFNPARTQKTTQAA